MESFEIHVLTKPLGGFISESGITSASSLDASIDYMRSSSPGTAGGNDLEPTWISESGYELLNYNLPPSPPFACPPTWLQLEFEQEFEVEDTITENDDESSRVELVPLSSSPPDFTSSSPHSIGSRDSEATSSSSLTSESADSLSESVSLSQLNPSLTNLPSGANVDDFGHRLHQLLLIALKERERERLSDQELTQANYHFRVDSNDTCTPEFSGSPNAQPATCAVRQRTLSPTSARHENDRDLDSSFDDSSSSYVSSSGLARDEVSPIQFEPSQELCIYPDLMTKTLDRPRNYRIIKRAQSYISHAIFDEQEEPLAKRQKTGKDSCAHANEPIYARRTASLRRADSLKALGNDNRQKSSGTVECLPTVPATPVPSTSERTQSKPEPKKVMMSPVPIIAPPLNHTAKLPLSTERLAKARVACFLEREADGRDADRLSSGICEHPPGWMLDTMISKWSVENSGHDLEDEIKYEWEAVMGLGSTTRESVVSWLLDVLPVRHSRCPTLTRSPLPPSSPSCSQYSTATSTSVSDSTHSKLGDNLFDQLKNSSETRFHAVWMFLRFFYLAMPLDPDAQSISKSRATKTLQHEKFAHGVWNIAVACLAISVKLHRDFLEPLIPVYACEYILVAPHSLSYEQLETAHRDILAVFDYRLGVTPQPVMDQLWFALSSLRALLDFEGGWQNATRDAWSCLYDCLGEPDVQRFPVSVLTAAALMGGIIQSLIGEYRREECLGAANLGAASRDLAEDNYFDARAIEDAEGVFCDIQALIGVTDVDLHGCRSWMSRVKRRLDVA